jgi:hypothetical protein
VALAGGQQGVSGDQANEVGERDGIYDLPQLDR